MYTTLGYELIALLMREYEGISFTNIHIYTTLGYIDYNEQKGEPYITLAGMWALIHEMSNPTQTNLYTLDALTGAIMLYNQQKED